MRLSHYRLFLLAALLAVFLQEPRPVGAQTSTTLPTDFKFFDNMFYPKRPQTLAEQFNTCNIVYADFVWKGAEKSPDYGKMPDEQAYKLVVKAHSSKPGPIVLDFETLRLSGKPEVVEPHFTLFSTLLKWTHEAAPGHVVGFYGHGLFPEEPGKEYTAQTAELIKGIDAFFPSMYTFHQDPQTWKKKADHLVQQAHTIAPGKPVYFYLWPQFHEAPHEFLTADQWEFELNTSREVGADGVVFWSSSTAPAWDANWPWWKVTLAFLHKK